MRPDADAEEDRAAALAPTVVPRAAWRIAELRVLDGYRLWVRFNDGTEGEVDLAAFVGSPDAGVFASLRDPAVFREARLVLGAITWPGGLDLAPDAMHRAINDTGVWVPT